MKYFYRVRKVCWLGLIQLVISAAIAVGCSKGVGPGGEISSKALEAAPAEVKQAWHDAMAAWKGGHYAQAATNFVVLKSKADSFSPEQAEELANAMGAFGRQTMLASGQGSADADAALNVLRTAGGGRK